ncbi:MAG: hypothetical protein K8T20_19495 [Planctomycetes bacterium]|nr:hypothetical protein [Planctomycetota bacterium]
MRFAPALLLAVLIAAPGCDQQPAKSHQEHPANPKSATSAYEDQVGELVGYLRFTKNEYAAAVRDGKVVDQREFDEATTMGLKPAERAWKALAATVESKDAAAAKAVTAGIADLRKLVDGLADAARVSDAVSAVSKALEGQLAGGVAPALRATVASVAAADSDIKGELVSGDYRFGFVAFAPRKIGHYDAAGVWAAEEPKGATHLLGIVVREKGTKRALASTKVTADWGAGPVELGSVWGDYLFYGANVALPEGSFTLKVEAEPPTICRHGDSMALFMTNGHAEFKVTRHGAEVTVEAPRPGPVNDGYRIGQDVEQAIAESMETKEEGDYRLGFIAEGPEPIWVWENGKLEAHPAKEGDTHHLEVALLERGTNRIVMAAKVTLEMKNKTSGATRTVELHNLLSDFAHYGQTLKVEPGACTVTVKAVPPSVGLFEEGKFRSTATAVFEWNGGEGK